MFAQARMIFYAVFAVVLIGAGITIKWQYGTINQLKEGLYNAINANKTNEQSIRILIEEGGKAAATCEARLSAKDALIKRLRAVDNLVPATASPGDPIVSPGVGMVGSVVLSGADSIISALNGMLPRKGGSPDGIYSSGSVTETAGAGILPGEMVYCTDEVNAKNLIKNILLMRAWAIDMMTILVSTNTTTL